jgi:organic radical activating enzyme
MRYEVRDGRIHAEAVEYSAAYHCNLRCAGCSHMSPFVSRRIPSSAAFAADVTRLATAFHAEEVRLLGGEPLLNPDIVSLLQVARASGIADRVVVTTNGLLLPGQPDAFWANVDEVRVSLYPGVSPPEAALDRIAARAQESGTRLQVTAWDRFRTTMVTEPHPADLTTAFIYRTCHSAHRCHMLHEGRLFKCPVPPFLPEFLSKLGRGGYDPSAEAFEIHGARDLFEELKAFLTTRRALEACRYCLGWVGRPRPHRQLSREVVTDPRREPVTRSRDLDRARLAAETARYVARRAAEMLTGQPRW